jgi:hypothetical protein
MLDLDALCRPAARVLDDAIEVRPGDRAAAGVQLGRRRVQPRSSGGDLGDAGRGVVDRFLELGDRPVLHLVPPLADG